MARIHGAAMTTSRHWTERDIADLLASPVVFAVGRPQGFALGRAVAGEAELLTIAVDPVAQGQGIGRALLLAVHAEAAQRGAAVIHLEVAADNGAARGLYAQAGYRASGRRPGYYARSGEPAVDALILARPLAP